MAIIQLVAGSLILIAVYHFIIEPTFISPLSKIPAAHWSAPLSRAWILYERLQRRETHTIHEAHQRLGPMVRIAPNEVSVNSVDGGLKSVYVGGFEKGNWYSNVFTNYGIEPMFAMSQHGPHSKRKRMVSNIYAKSTLQSSTGLPTITSVLLTDRLIPRLRELSKSGQIVEFYDIFSAITTDFVSSYVFGLKSGSNYVEHPEMNRKFFRDYKARQMYQFWPQELPDFCNFMKRLGLLDLVIPYWVNSANNDIEDWILSMCDNAEATLNSIEKTGKKPNPEDYPTVYAQLREALIKETTKTQQDLPIDQFVKTQRLTIASEMLDHTLAGFDTSSITLTFLAWQLSRSENKVWQDKLRSEIAKAPDVRDGKAIDALPVLHAIIMETLRLHAAIPGNQPRITPIGASLGPPGSVVSGLPGNVRVQAQAWSLHRNPDVFPDPEAWRPDRWLEATEAQQREMTRWFWAFGSGGRMCVGSNLAMYDMKAIVFSIWGAFKTELVDGEGMVHAGTYVAEPVGKDGKYCLLRLDASPAI
ncbi:Hypothetical protein R9X50_00051600 [Acrodontium crateriforme]|uniref:Cytochrome P450 monooxygenase n=1 Tax=Acrodontium crateriforme TaxID=150365 RepID=A0AAQ3R705_9PEZI|nr:Hypothetical protein R9X50_00051600 [Acrodontium crateriforme]